MTESQLQEIAKVFERAKADVEALLKPAPKAVDFGEPVIRKDGCTSKKDGSFCGSDYYDRAAVCVNSLAGIADPESFVRLAKEMARCM